MGWGGFVMVSWYYQLLAPFRVNLSHHLAWAGSGVDRREFTPDAVWFQPFHESSFASLPPTPQISARPAALRPHVASFAHATRNADETVAHDIVTAGVEMDAAMAVTDGPPETGQSTTGMSLAVVTAGRGVATPSISPPKQTRPAPPQLDPRNKYGTSNIVVPCHKKLFLCVTS